MRKSLTRNRHFRDRAISPSSDIPRITRRDALKWGCALLLPGCQGLFTNDKATIEAKVEELSKVSAPVSQKMYAEQAPQGDGAAQQAEPEAKHDDVVDAEFEEVKEDQKK